MKELRFRVGVPRAGSAARTAEQDDTGSGRIVRPQAGSAARAAEAEKALGSKSIAGFSLRAREGVVGRQTHLIQAESNRVSGVGALRESASFLPNGAERVAQNDARVVAPSAAEHQSQSPAGPLPIAGRLQALVRSLFAEGDTPGKS